MKVLHVAGVDPGIVHTGVVVLRLDTDKLRLHTTWRVVDGLDAAETAAWVLDMGEPQVFIEKYRPRSHYGTDERMVKAERDFKLAMPRAVLIDNTGIKKVVTDDLLNLLELWKFALPSHHQDLRSAARIAVLGMLRDPVMNKELARYVEELVLHGGA